MCGLCAQPMAASVEACCWETGQVLTWQSRRTLRQVSVHLWPTRLPPHTPVVTATAKTRHFLLTHPCPIRCIACRGNMPQSYKRNLTKTTPATDDKVKPLDLFKTPQTTASAAAAATKGARGLDNIPTGAAAAAAAPPSPPPPPPPPSPVALAAAPAAQVPCSDSQMLDALRQTVQETHTGLRPSSMGSLIAAAPAGTSPPAGADQQAEVSCHADMGVGGRQGNQEDAGKLQSNIEVSRPGLTSRALQL